MNVPVSVPVAAVTDITAEKAAAAALFANKEFFIVHSLRLMPLPTNGAADILREEKWTIPHSAPLFPIVPLYTI